MDNVVVTTLEMDLAITKDKQVVVSHDPILNPLITTKPDGSFIKASELNKKYYLSNGLCCFRKI